jgi:hypothetical protein
MSEKYTMDATSEPTADIVIDVDNLATNDSTEYVNYNPMSWNLNTFLRMLS